MWVPNDSYLQGGGGGQMRSLSLSSGDVPAVFERLRAKAGYASALVYLLSLVYFIGIVWPAFNERTRFSENALLPGVVDDQFVERDRMAGLGRQLRQVIAERSSRFVSL